MLERKRKIGIDCRCLSISGGVRRYAISFIKNLIELDKENEYYLFYNDKRSLGTFRADNFHEICLAFPWPNLYFIWDQVILAWLCWKYDVDIVHGLKNSVPIFVKARRIVTVHDLIPVLFPSTMKWYHALYWRLVFFIDAKVKMDIICISKSTKDDFERRYRTANTLRVVHLGVHLKDGDNGELLSSRENVVLYVGTLEPRKNVSYLIRAFGHFLRTHPGFVLYLVGKSGWEDPEIDRAVKELGLGSSVIKKGFVSEDELVSLYKTSGVFAYMSSYEGFGLPVLEAMSYGLPSIASANSSFFEISNHSAVLVDPHDVLQVSNALTRIVGDRDYRLSLVEAGLENVKGFSWSKCAQETLKIYAE